MKKTCDVPPALPKTSSEEHSPVHDNIRTTQAEKIISSQMSVDSLVDQCDQSSNIHDPPETVITKGELLLQGDAESNVAMPKELEKEAGQLQSNPSPDIRGQEETLLQEAIKFLPEPPILMEFTDVSAKIVAVEQIVLLDPPVEATKFTENEFSNAISESELFVIENETTNSIQDVSKSLSSQKQVKNPRETHQPVNTLNELLSQAETSDAAAEDRTAELMTPLKLQGITKISVPENHGTPCPSSMVLKNAQNQDTKEDLISSQEAVELVTCAGPTDSLNTSPLSVENQTVPTSPRSSVKTGEALAKPRCTVPSQSPSIKVKVSCE